MKYVTSLERDALEEGFEKGIVQGKKLGVVDSTDLYQANVLSRERRLLSYLPVTRDWCFFRNGLWPWQLADMNDMQEWQLNQQGTAQQEKCWLYQQRRVTLGKAAELAGCDIYDVMSICKTNRQPVIDMTRDELLEELNGFAQS
ncbi:MAG: UPF0175 family protein [Chlorobium sp.]